MERCHHHGWHGEHRHADGCGCAERFDERAGPKGCGCAHHYGPGLHGPEGEDVRLRRRFRSREERLAELEEYRNDLHAELKGVEERIAEIKAAP